MQRAKQLVKTSQIQNKTKLKLENSRRSITQKEKLAFQVCMFLVWKKLKF